VRREGTSVSFCRAFPPTGYSKIGEPRYTTVVHTMTRRSRGSSSLHVIKQTLYAHRHHDLPGELRYQQIPSWNEQSLEKVASQLSAIISSLFPFHFPLKCWLVCGRQVRRSPLRLSSINVPGWSCFVSEV